VAVLVDERRGPGDHEVTFNAGGLSSGLYVYRLQVRSLDSAIGRDSRSGAGDVTLSRTMMLLK
jgi:hypothetical protein